MFNTKRYKIGLFIIFSIYIIAFSYADTGLFSWFISDEGLWANDAKWMVLWNSLPEDGFVQSLFAAPLFYLNEYYAFFLWLVTGVAFFLFIGQMVPRRMICLFFPIFVLSEKGINRMRGGLCVK